LSRQAWDWRDEHSFLVVRCPRNSECRSVVLKHMGWRTVADGRAKSERWRVLRASPSSAHCHGRTARNPQ
jgi:hypothetical protein